MGALPLVPVVAALLAGCASSPPPAVTVSNGPGPTASAAAPGGPAASQPVAAPTASAPSSPKPSASAVGAYTVTLTGPKTGAGTYTGTTDVYCAAPTIDGRVYWTATAVLFGAPFGSLTDFGIQENPSGFDTVSATAGGMETGSWFATSSSPGQSATATGTGVPGANGHVSGDGSFSDSAGRVFTIHIVAECSDTSY